MRVKRMKIGLILGDHVSFFNLLHLAFRGENSSEDACIESNADTSKDIEEDSEEIEEIKEKSKNSVKFVDQFEQDESDKKCVGAAISSKERDPLTLDLFEESTCKHKPISKTTSDVLKISKSQGKRFSKLKRSLSQPHFYSNSRPESKFLRFGINLYKRNLNVEMEQERRGSMFYLYTLLWACGAMLFWKNVVLLPLLPLPILFYTFKHIGFYLGIWQYVHAKICSIWRALEIWCWERHDALVPIPIRGLYKITYRVNTAIKTLIRESIDTVCSCIVIVSLIVFLVCASIFIIIQIYAEAIMLVQITGNVINQTVVHNPELRQLLPTTFDDTVDSVLDNAYQYGREGLSKAVKGLMTDVDSAKSEKIERQVLELWDRIYQSWMTSASTNGPTVTQEAVASSWEAFIADIKKSPEMFNIRSLMEFGKQNIGTLMSLLESIWSVVKGNISLILGSLGAFISVILGGGTAVMNFILNLVVFLTTLFYLLNSSGDLYKPVEIMTNFSPSGSRFGHALGSAINGVFAASFKMAAFYGLWTWFIHNLFGVRIVYLPSAFAMILGAVPFLGTYWAGVPAVLDLWLAQDRGIAAIFFAGFQFLPTSIVDITIYKEIKGGHPYLTGLAIAGGVFCLGVEGAIIGPILLCGLYVAMDLSSNMFMESPSQESLDVHNVHIRQIQDN
ncbi:hypothetical protein WA026_007885 [Henosepilachna vigintioctopunctata]|uniref:Transmembrane protein 245 n=1 Tax=Henosepilachna vigintioctopunctata TaxID=420089 RepID=A0AAW1TXR7_9CUCU